MPCSKRLTSQPCWEARPWNRRTQRVCSGWSEDPRQVGWRNGYAKRNRRSWSGGEAWIDDIGRRSGQEIVLPNVGRDGCDRASEGDFEFFGAPGRPVSRAGQIHSDSFCIQAAGSPHIPAWTPRPGWLSATIPRCARSFRDRRVHLITQSIIEHQAIRDLPGVLNIEVHSITGIRGNTDLVSLWKTRRATATRYENALAIKRALEVSGKGAPTSGMLRR